MPEQPNNNSIQRRGASRSSQFAFGRQRRLPLAAHPDCSPEGVMESFARLVGNN